MRRLATGPGASRLADVARMALVWMICALALSGCSLNLFGAAPAPTPAPSPTPTAILYTCQGAYLEANPVAAENTCPGTTAWGPNLSLGPDHAIEGYVSSASVAAGQRVRLYVSTTAVSYTYAIYRMGYYQGRGARLMYQSPSLSGIQQPAPTIDSVTHMVECVWSHPATITTERSWVSGVYVVKLVSSDKFMRYTLFVVRNAATPASILYVAPFLTYQAYNLWGGFSLYRGTEPDGVTLSSALRSYTVSFDRPYMKDGLSTFGLYDLPLLSWAESRGYNMTYAADFNLDGMSGSVSHYKLFIISGHSEYWSAGMRANATRARDAGVSLAFFGANDVYWHVRLKASPMGSDREVVCYKHGYYDDGTRNSTDPLAASDPSAATVLWRDPPLNQPEWTLLGEPYRYAVQGFQPLTLDKGSAPYLAGTSLAVGASLSNLVGGEYDRADPTKSPAGLQIIASSVVHCASYCPHGAADTATASIYTAASGAQVFDAGTFQWSWGLSDISAKGYVQATNALAQITPVAQANSGFQRLTANILDAMMR
ncbi:MAG: hypothetical protein KGO05_16170 [Chloroflexota bacterium]|nr:hypothetical protein [Chloroflexota bacterium]